MTYGPSRFAYALASAALACATSPAPAPQAPPPAATASASGSAVGEPAEQALQLALSGPQRPAAERERDVYRHPRETLEFFGLKSNDVVVELSAGRGWYTAILAPLLRERGKLFLTTADPNGPPEAGPTKAAKQLAERLAADPQTFGKVTPLIVNFKEGASLGPDGSADKVLTFRNLHNWIEAGVIDQVLAASFRVLKPGGTLGVEEHRANAGAPTDAKAIAQTGYVPEAYAISLAEKAGFKLVAKSEVNANPKDTKDYPKGVWTLPPTFTLGDTDRDKYLAIGESDRMVLKFVKP